VCTKYAKVCTSYVFRVDCDVEIEGNEKLKNRKRRIELMDERMEEDSLTASRFNCGEAKRRNLEGKKESPLHSPRLMRKRKRKQLCRDTGRGKVAN
jgi:hypothetical protein